MLTLSYTQNVVVRSHFSVRERKGALQDEEWPSCFRFPAAGKQQQWKLFLQPEYSNLPGTPKYKPWDTGTARVITLAFWTQFGLKAVGRGAQAGDQLRAGVLALSTDLSVLHVSEPLSCSITLLHHQNHEPVSQVLCGALHGKDCFLLNLTSITAAQGCRECLLQMRTEIVGTLLLSNDVVSSFLCFGPHPDATEGFRVRFSFVLCFFVSFPKEVSFITLGAKLQS